MRLSVYLDTSSLNFLFADDSPEKKEITVDFFKNFIKTGVYQSYISDFVIQEINQTANKEKRENLLSAIDEHFVEKLEISNPDEIRNLANQYLEYGVVPKNKLLDALHIACAVTNRIDFLASWNYKHLANVNRERKVGIVNARNNYLHPIRILTPIDLIDYGN